MKFYNLFFLVLFTAISTVLIFFGFDLIFGNFNLFREEDFLLIAHNNNQIGEGFTCLSMKEELKYNKVSIFNPFIDLFNKSHSTYRYFPSHFQVLALEGYDNISINNNTSFYDLLIIKEAISYNKYLILEQHNNYLSDVLNDLYKIILNYKQDK